MEPSVPSQACRSRSRRTGDIQGTATFQFALSNASGPSAPVTASIIVGPPPIARILFNDTDVTNSTQPIVVATGQQIRLRASPPDQETIEHSRWGVRGAIKSYGPTNSSAPCNLNPLPDSSACLELLQLSESDFGETSVTFYWTTQDTYTVTFTYTLSDGLSSTSRLMFRVVGPQNVNIRTSFGLIQVIDKGVLGFTIPHLTCWNTII